MAPEQEPSDEPNKQRGPGRPRDPKRGRAIRQATLDLLSEEGYAGLTMVDVAERAGVSKTTIYRRWPTKAEMVLAAIAEEVEPDPIEDTDDPLADLRRLMIRFYRRVLGQLDGLAPIAPAELLKEAEVVEPFNRHFVHPMRQRALELVERAVEQGQLRADLQPAQLVDTLTAPALYRSVALGTRAEPELAEAVFEMVMRGARAR